MIRMMPALDSGSRIRRTSIDQQQQQQDEADPLIDLESSQSQDSMDDAPPLFRRQVLFGLDLSGLPPHMQFIVPAVGLFLFMCLYGYLQELVVYGLFERKWSNLQTFLHFFGCIICAEIQSFFSSSRQYNKQKSTPFLTMGSATTREAFYYYFFLTLLKTLTMTFTNLSMTRINYPAKTMCKSALPIVTMAIGIFWFRKSYPLRDYFVSILLVAGLYLFISGDSSNSLSGTGMGIFFVMLSLVGAALIPMVQEHIMDTYEANTEELLYFSFLGSTIMSFIFTFLSGEAFEGTVFLLTKGTLFMWFCFTLFNTCGFLGAACSIALTARFGSVVNALTNTSRKAMSIALSFLMFPDRNTLNIQHIIGSIVFFSGILVRGIMKGEKEAKRRRSVGGYKDNMSSDNLDNEEMVSVKLASAANKKPVPASVTAAYTRPGQSPLIVVNHHHRLSNGMTQTNGAGLIKA